MEDRKIFNKLVRDRIPEIIESHGNIPEIEVLDDLAYSKALDEKLREECNELFEANSREAKVEEIADTLKVLHAIADTLNITMDEIENVRKHKQEKRGAFKKKFFLKSTTPKI
ncbi:MAG: nucleoside triphosphate pyrophosphohydrolase [Oscillospiraceae bacterium]|nr:nucleoside triphosphate pyrophosphohydrolase [Oscillospiraceae bacterium]